jgi:hypothetical protein
MNNVNNTPFSICISCRCVNFLENVFFCFHENIHLMKIITTTIVKMKKELEFYIVEINILI